MKSARGAWAIWDKFEACQIPFRFQKEKGGRMWDGGYKLKVS